MSEGNTTETIRLGSSKGIGKRLERRRLAYMAAVMVSAAALASFGTVAATLAVIGAIPLSAAALFIFSAKVKAGGDGMAFWGEGFPSYVPWADVRRIEEEKEGVRISLEDGGALLLPHGRPGDLRRRLESRLRWFEQGPANEIPSALLIEASDDDEQGYRSAAPPPVETLVEIASDPRVKLEVRLRAAKLTAGRGSARSRKQVRVAAQKLLDHDAREALISAVGVAAKSMES